VHRALGDLVAYLVLGLLMGFCSLIWGLEGVAMLGLSALFAWVLFCVSKVSLLEAGLICYYINVMYVNRAPALADWEVNLSFTAASSLRRCACPAKHVSELEEYSDERRQPPM
jgi:hypothetical protein